MEEKNLVYIQNTHELEDIIEKSRKELTILKDTLEKNRQESHDKIKWLEKSKETGMIQLNRLKSMKNADHSIIQISDGVNINMHKISDKLIEANKDIMGKIHEYRFTKLEQEIKPINQRENLDPKDLLKYLHVLESTLTYLIRQRKVYFENDFTRGFLISHEKAIKDREAK